MHFYVKALITVNQSLSGTLCKVSAHWFHISVIEQYARFGIGEKTSVNFISLYIIIKQLLFLVCNFTRRTVLVVLPHYAAESVKHHFIKGYI